MAKTRPARYDRNEVYIDGTDRKPRLENVDDRAGTGIAELGHLPHVAFLSSLKEQTNAGQQG